MNTDLFVKGLEKEHQKEMDALRKDLSYQVWQAKQEQKETVKKVFSVLQIADHWWSGLFESCPDEKIVFKKLQEKMRDLKRKTNIIDRLARDLCVEEKEVIKEVKELTKVEDENQELKDEKVESAEKHKLQLEETKERMETAAAVILRAAEDVQASVNQVAEEKEKVKKEILEEEKK